MDRKKELKLTYKQTSLPMGAYQIKNSINGKIFVGSSMNLPGIFNRHRFQLNAASHPIKDMQEDWHQYGSAAFTCEVLEVLKPEEVLKEDYQKTILALEDKWLTNLRPYGEKGYNKLKIKKT